MVPKMANPEGTIVNHPVAMRGKDNRGSRWIEPFNTARLLMASVRMTLSLMQRENYREAEEIR
jgi:hypothetical protein